TKKRELQPARCAGIGRLAGTYLFSPASQRLYNLMFNSCLIRAVFGLTVINKLFTKVLKKSIFFIQIHLQRDICHKNTFESAFRGEKNADLLVNVRTFCGFEKNIKIKLSKIFFKSFPLNDKSSSRCRSTTVFLRNLVRYSSYSCTVFLLLLVPHILCLVLERKRVVFLLLLDRNLVLIWLASFLLLFSD
ncbi:unnamed protein product, partial [Oikopleura dioica]